MRLKDTVAQLQQARAKVKATAKPQPQATRRQAKKGRLRGWAETKRKEGSA